MQEITPERLNELKPNKNMMSESPHRQIDSRWVQVKFSQGFSPRSYFAACLQAGNIYLHGGHSAEKGIQSDLLSCNLYNMPASWKELQSKSKCNPGPLRNHTLSAFKSSLILVGGQQNVIKSNDKIFRFDLMTNCWSEVACRGKDGARFDFALDSHSAIVHKNDLYLIGGYDAKETVFSNAIIRIQLAKIVDDEASFETIVPELGPIPRASSGCVLLDDQIFMFGGGRMNEAFADLWVWNINERNWKQMVREHQNFSWPDKRKGATLVLHEQSKNIFLFGGIKAVTKESNDVFIWATDKRRWVKIHSNTNDLYDPSPTVKHQLQSPTVSSEKRRKEKMKTQGNLGGFKIGLQTVSHSSSISAKMNETSWQITKSNQAKVQRVESSSDIKRKMSVVQEKKYREFLARKKRLISTIEAGFDKNKERKSHSPTSEAIMFSLNTLGNQSSSQEAQLDLPKVIYNQEKGQLLGKKPCARDGHAALVHEQNMIILGGDRHMVSFNDAYLFKMDKGLESLPHYE